MITILLEYIPNHPCINTQSKKLDALLRRSYKYKILINLLYTLNTCSQKNKNWIINTVKKYNKDKKRVKEVITFVKDNGGIEYTINKMNDYKDKALAILNNYPDSEYKKSLLLMIDYVVERKI